MTESSPLKQYEAEDFVHAIAIKAKKQKGRVREAKGWRIVGSGRNFIVKVKGDTKMLIEFGGVHPIINKFDDIKCMKRYVATRLTALGFKEDKKGRFYVGKR